MGLLDVLKMPRSDHPDRKAALQGRSQIYNLLDNIIGFDDDRVTPGEAFGAGLREDPVGLLSSAAQGVKGDLDNLMFEGGAIERPQDVLGYAAAPMAPGVRGLLSNNPNVMSANPVMRAAMGPEERIAASTPASWRDPKFEKPQWHPISSTSMTTPASDIRVATEDLGVLSPSRNISIEDLQGRVMTPALGDRTIAGVNITGYDDVAFGNPVRSQGGRDFMREEGTGLWASEYTPMSRKAKAVQGLLDQGEDPALVYTAMGAQSGDFSTIMMDAVMNQFDATKISDDAAKKFDDRMAKLKIKGWPGTKSGKVGEALAEMPGSSRWAVWQEMDKAGYRDAGFPDIGKTRVSITDPELLDVDPFAAGLNIGRPQGLLTNELFTPHPSYEYQIGGNYEGGIGNMPGQLIWRDFFEGRRASGAAPAGDQRAFMMQSPSMTQRVDQQMIDEVSEYLRRLEQGQ